MLSQKIIAKVLRDAADRIDNGTCGLTEAELMALGAAFCHREMNIEQLCNYYRISRATLNRWQEKGKLPPFRKESGGKVFLWLDECEAWTDRWEAEHGKGE